MAVVTEGLTLDLSDPLYKLIADIPDFASNPVGKVAREALVSKLKGSTPGQPLYHYSGSSTFLNIFFPKYSAAPYEGDVVAQTGLDDTWWSDFSVAVLCQSMYWQTSDLRPQLLIDDINGAVNSNNTTLKEKAVQWYSHVLFLDYMQYNGDLAAAKTAYIDQICTETWVTFKMKQFNDGTWANYDWEEFHHWTKLSALGASDDEITGIINRLRDLGLRISPNVDVNTWRSYLVWCNPDSIDHTDVDSDAKNGQLQEAYRPPEFVIAGHGLPVWVPEGNSIEFTNTLGSKYYSSSSSCFSPTTKVLLPDGSLKEIGNIKVGDKVQTPSGSRQVLLVSTPMRNGRTLYNVNNLPGFNFTATHPFLNGRRSSPGEPLFLAVSPMDLARMVPFIGYEGIGKLETGTHLVGFKDGVCQQLLVESVEEFPSGPNDEQLYDLILEPDASGQFDYIVGVKDSLFVVASELSPFKNATTAELLGGPAILHTISTASQPLQTLLDSSGEHLFPSKIDHIACRLSSSLLPYASSLTSSASIYPEHTMTDHLEFVQYVLSKMEMFVSSDGTYNLATGEAFAYISARLGHQLASAVQLGYRIIHAQTDPDVMAVSLLDIQVTAPLRHHSLLNPIVTLYMDDHSPLQHKIKENRVPFGIRIYKTFYIPLHELGNGNEHHIEICIEVTEGCKGVLQSSTHITLPLQNNYHHYRLPVLRDHEEKGILSIDIRLLSTTDMNEEKEACCSWDGTKMFNFTECLAKAGGEMLYQLCKLK